MALRVVAWASAGVFVVLWLVAMAAGADPYVLCPEAALDGSSLAAQLTLWPPGAIECTYVSTDGDVTRSTRIAWDAWISAALFAAGAACAASAPFHGGMRLLLAVAAALLVPGAAAVWFL
jgi:hypothetical protein